MRLTLTVVFIAFATLLSAQQKSAYKLYNAKGKKTSYTKMLKKANTADYVFFGELHNNPIAHWLQLELTKDASTSRQLVLGAEMFEADNQEALNDYLKGNIDAKGLDSLARLWPNYKTDYAPLVNFAKEKQLDFIATNVPRRFASKVYRGGFEALESLSDREKEWVAPLPIVYDAEVACYKNMLEMAMGHGGDNLPKAQAIKDATMAFFIKENTQPGTLFIHYNGTYHSDNHEGIVWYLKNDNENVNVLTIATVVQDDINKLSEENKGKADFIICVDGDMTTTY